MPGLRVVIDTDVLVSGLAYPASIPGHIVTLWRHGALKVALSRYILDETARELPRLTRIQLSFAEIRDLVDSLMFLADVVEPVAQNEEELRDAADQQVLGTLIAARQTISSRVTRTCWILPANIASLHRLHFGSVMVSIFL